MVKILAFLIILTSTPSVTAGDLTLWTKTQLRSIFFEDVIRSQLYRRCRSFFPKADHEGVDLYSKECLQASQDLQREMDCRYFAKSDRVRCFATELSELLSSHETAAYLEALKSQSSLWDFTLQWEGGNKEKALKRIAVLFQDPLNGFHLNDDLAHLPAYAALVEANAQFKKERLLPDSLPQAQGGVYHFYVPAYTSYLMKKYGYRTEVLSRLLPFLFNMNYELFFLKLKEHMDRGDDEAPLFRMYFGKMAPDRYDLRDPYTLSTLSDIYLGHLGVAWVDENIEKENFESFSREFSQNPKRLIQNLYFSP